MGDVTPWLTLGNTSRWGAHWEAAIRYGQDRGHAIYRRWERLERRRRLRTAAAIFGVNTEGLLA
jgi:hypothetical protein